MEPCRNYVLCLVMLFSMVICATPRTAQGQVERPNLTLSSTEGDSSIRFQLAVQLQHSYSLLDDGPSQPSRDESSVFFRRLRPVISGHLLGEDLNYRLHLNLVPGALELMDCWLSYPFHEQVTLLIGQGKIPFTRYRLNSFQDLPFVDWSNPTRWFGAERQMGAMLHNGVGRPGTLEYQLGVFTGVNARASNAVGMERAFGEQPPNPSALDDPAPPDGFHPEIVAHLGYNDGDINVRRATDFEGGPLRFSVGLSAALDLSPTATADWTVRVAPEFLIKAHSFFAQGVFYLGFWDEVTGFDTYQLGTTAALFQAGYLFAEQYETAMRYSIVHLLPDLRQDALRHAEARIAEGDNDAEVTELAANFASVGHIVAEHELNLGFNVYLLGTTLKLQFDTSLLYHDRTDDDLYDFRIRSQVQLGF